MAVQYLLCAFTGRPFFVCDFFNIHLSMRNLSDILKVHFRLDYFPCRCGWATAVFFCPDKSYSSLFKESRSPLHPFHTSLKVSSKLWVYQGSAISPGEDVKSRSREILLSGSPPVILRIFFRFH